jgi:hypothetical protein
MQAILNTAVLRMNFPDYPHGYLLVCRGIDATLSLPDLDEFLRSVRDYVEGIPASSMEEEKAAELRMNATTPLYTANVFTYPLIKLLPATRGMTVCALLHAAIKAKRTHSARVCAVLLATEKWVADAGMLATAAQTGRADIVAVLLEAGADASAVRFDTVPKNLKRQCRNKACTAENCNITVLELLVRAGGRPGLTAPVMCALGETNLATSVREGEMRSLALGMGLHERLGAASSLRVLDDELLNLINAAAATSGFARASLFGRP